MGGAGAYLGQGRCAEGHRANRWTGKEGTEIARRVYLYDQRLQAESSCRGDGADRAALVTRPHACHEKDPEPGCNGATMFAVGFTLQKGCHLEPSKPETSRTRQRSSRLRYQQALA